MRFDPNDPNNFRNPLYDRLSVPTTNTPTPGTGGAEFNINAGVTESTAQPRPTVLDTQGDANNVRAQLFGAGRVDSVGSRGGPGPYGDLYPRIMAPGGGHYEALVTEHNGLPLNRG